MGCDRQAAEWLGAVARSLKPLLGDAKHPLYARLSSITTAGESNAEQVAVEYSDLPAVPGNEGVARVLRVGGDVTHVRAGDRVVLSLLSGAWRERLVIPAAGLFPYPTVTSNNSPCSAPALDSTV